MEEGVLKLAEAGMPQGGRCSPALKNIYLYYALDLWFERIVKKNMRGYVELVLGPGLPVMKAPLKQSALLCFKTPGFVPARAVLCRPGIHRHRARPAGAAARSHKGSLEPGL